MNTGLDWYSGFISALKSGDNFAFSFFIGFVAIIFHARKRLQIIAPRGDEYDFVRLISLPAVVGRAQYRRLLLIYTLCLQLLYLFICVSKPLFPNLFGNNPDYQGAAWPLGAALVVVGLLPSTPYVDEIEMSLRKFAFNAADVPDEFFRRVTRLSQSEIRNYLEKDDRYTEEMERYWRIYNLAVLVGHASSEAHITARRVIGSDLFSRWILDDSVSWSPGEYDKLRDVVDILKPKVEAQRREVDELVADTELSKVVRYLLTESGLSLTEPFKDGDIHILRGLIAKLPNLTSGDESKFTSGDLELYKTLPQRWGSKMQGQLGLNRQLCGLFVIIALNDRKFVLDYIYSERDDQDNVLKQILVLVEQSRPQESRTVYNALALACLSGFAVCFVIFSVYRTLTDGTDLNPIGPFEFSFYTSLTLGLTCFLAGFSALVIRTIKIDRKSWRPFTGFGAFPIIQYRGIIAMSGVVSFVIYLMLTLGYTYRAGDIDNVIRLGADGTFRFIFFHVFWSLIPVTFSIGLCVVADIFEDSSDFNIRKKFIAMLMSSIVIFASYIVHQSYQTVDNKYMDIFWSAMVSTAVFAFIGHMAFGISMRAHAKNNVMVQ